jgi:hypothetical protein
LVSLETRIPIAIEYILKENIRNNAFGSERAAMANDKQTGLRSSIPRLGRRVGLEADRQEADPLKQTFQDPLPPDKEGWRLLSPHIRKTKLPVYTELAVPGGHSVLLLHEYGFNERQLDKIRHNVGRARANVDAGIDALSKDSSQYDSKTSALLKQHFLIDADPDAIGGTGDILRELRKISAGLNGPNVEIKVLDDLSKRFPESPAGATGMAWRRFSGEESPQVSFRIQTSAALDAELGPRVMIHETAHNVAGLDDHGERGYLDDPVAGQPMRYRENGLTFHEALINADTYAAFCCELQRCPPSIKWSLPPTETVHFGSKEPEERFKAGISAETQAPIIASDEHAKGGSVSTDSKITRPSLSTDKTNGRGFVERVRSSLSR